MPDHIINIKFFAEEGKISSAVSYAEKCANMDLTKNLKKLHTASVQSISCYFSNEQIQAWTSGSEEDFFQIVEKFFSLYVIYYDDFLMGFVGLLYKGYIQFFYFHPDYQHKGYGKIVLKMIEDDIRNRNTDNKIGLKANKSAVSFYLKQGYRIIKEDELDFSGVILPVCVMEKTFH